MAVVLLAITVLATTLLSSGTVVTAGATVGEPARAAAHWMASQVGPDGAVIDPYSTQPSVDWSVNVALGLATTGTEPEALARAVSYIDANVMAYVNGGTSDVVGRYAWLTLLADALGRDPRSFGDSHTDLIAGINGRWQAAEPDVFGTIDAYTPVTNQALAIMALIAAGEPEPTAAIQWLLDQQCTSPASSVGAWQGYRVRSAGVPVQCSASVSGSLTGPDVNSTSFATQALAFVQRSSATTTWQSSIDLTALPAAAGWLHSIEVPSGSGVGGFGQTLGDAGDPNSTAVGVMMIRSLGQDPDAAPWMAGGVTPLDSLVAWQIPTGAEAGGYASPWSSGYADLYATYQAVWGVADAILPIVMPDPDPVPDPTTTIAVVEAVAPSFTG